MVIKDKVAKQMLDDSTPAQKELDEIKIKLHQLLNYDKEDLAD